MPTMSTGSEGFSLINWEKEEFNTALFDFLVEEMTSVLHRRVLKAMLKVFFNKLTLDMY